MSFIKALLLVCDDCGNDLRFVDVNQREAHATAKTLGWVVHLQDGAFRDRCPACVSRYGKSSAHSSGDRSRPWGNALREVLDDGREIKATARKWGLPYRTLCQRVRDTRKARADEKRR